MNNISRLLVIASLLVFSSTGAFGAVHHMGDRIVTDTWYTITPSEPYWQLFSMNTPDFRLNTAGGEFYQNDQTFFLIQTNKFGNSNLSGLSGSYLFDTGFFIGMDYLRSSTHHETMISPGYRLSFDENSYLALSSDYESSSERVIGYDLDLCYYFDNVKISGEIYNPRDGDTSIDIGVAFAANEALVIGFDYTHSDKTFSTGFTYTGNPVIVDFTYLNDEYDDYSYYKLSGMFNIGEDYGLGLTIQKYDDTDDPKYTLKFRYKTNHTSIKFIYTPESGPWEMSYGMVCYTTF